MKIVVIGSSGLIGCNLIPLINTCNDVVTVQRRRFRTSDILIDLDSNWSEDILPKQADSVVYLAQSEKFRDFPNSAESIFRVNCLSLLKALDYARRAGVRTFVYASSGGVYGNSTLTCNEDAPIGPSGELGFYLGTKLCGEIIAENYTSYMNVIIVRPFFVYGPRQRKDMLIPRLTERVRNEQAIQLIGDDGLLINPIYVEDAAQAIKQALSLETSCKINIAGPDILSMRQIGELIGQTLGKKVFFEQKQGTAGKMIGSIEKMSRLLWLPRITFAEGIKRYINFLLEKTH